MNLNELESKKKNIVEKQMAIDQDIAKLASEKNELEQSLADIQGKINNYANQKQNELVLLEKQREELTLKVESMPELKQLDEVNKKIDQLKKGE